MKSPIARITLGVIAALSTAQAGAVVLTFDDLPIFKEPTSWTGLAGSFFNDTSVLTDYTYAGFRFADEGSTQWFWNPNPGDPAVPGQAPYHGVNNSTWIGVFNASGNLAPAITSSTDFVFDGASFSGYDPVRFKIYLDGDLKFTSASCALSNATTFCASGYGGAADKVVVENLTDPAFSPGIYFAMDNFTYHVPVPVPEPSTYALMAGGLAALALTARRRRKAA